MASSFTELQPSALGPEPAVEGESLRHGTHWHRAAAPNASAVWWFEGHG